MPDQLLELSFPFMQVENDLMFSGNDRFGGMQFPFVQ